MRCQIVYSNGMSDGVRGGNVQAQILVRFLAAMPFATLVALPVAVLDYGELARIAPSALRAGRKCIWYTVAAAAPFQLPSTRDRTKQTSLPTME